MSAILDDGAVSVNLKGLERLFAVAATVAGRAGRQHFDKGKPSPEQGFFEGLGEVPRVQNGPPGHIGRSCSIGQEREVERRFRVAHGSGGGICHTGRGGRCLAAGHAVIEIVDANHCQIDVAACGMDKVVAADGEEVAVTAEDHHIQFGIGELHARGEGNGPAVGGVVGIELDIAGSAARAADPRHHDGLFQIDAASLHGHQTRGKSRADAAPGTPDVRHTLGAKETIKGVFQVNCLS